MVNTIWIKEDKKLIVFDDIIVDMLNNRKLNPIATELFIRSGNLNKRLVFITQYFFAVPNTIRLNPIEWFIMKIVNKAELR